MSFSYKEYKTDDGPVCHGTFVWEIDKTSKFVEIRWLLDSDSRYPSKVISVSGHFLTMDIGMALSDSAVTGYAEAEALLRSTALRDWVFANQLTYVEQFEQMAEQSVTIKWRMVTGKCATIEILNVDGIPNMSIGYSLPSRDDTNPRQYDDMILLLSSTALRDWLVQHR